MFDISEVLGKGWDDFKNNAVTLVAAIIVVIAVCFAISLGFQIAGGIVGDSVVLMLAVSAVSMVVNLIVSTLLQLGMIEIFLKIVRGQDSSVSDLFVHLDKVVPASIASFLISIGVAVGMVFLILPGIIIAIVTAFTLWFIADQNLGAVAAIKASVAATEGERLRLFFFGLAAIGISMVGILAFGVGLLVAVPVLGCAGARIYLALTEGSASEAPVPVSGPA